VNGAAGFQKADTDTGRRFFLILCGSIYLCYIMTLRKKIILGIVGMATVVGAVGAWLFFGPAAKAPEGKYLYIKTGSSYETVKQQLLDRRIISGAWSFNWLAQRLDYPQSVKAGRYEIKDGMSLMSLIRMLRSGRQSEVNFTIKKLRTPEDLATLVGRQLECDSAAFINFLRTGRRLASDGFDSNTVMTVVIPNTYKIRWNSTPQQVFDRLLAEQRKFWTPQRVKLADAHNLNPLQAYTLASIVEEETNKAEDKGKIASVYLNRLETGMKLGADPTVKFALRDFGLKRILNKHLTVESPYNTYLNMGLPPGPICTPSPQTIDAVLNAPHTSYLYFVAQPNLTGYSNFATTYDEHLQYARQYQVWIDSFLRAKAVQKQLLD
jgi:UPF0755 protein